MKSTVTMVMPAPTIAAILKLDVNTKTLK
jgi:hypothetical protein